MSQRAWYTLHALPFLISAFFAVNPPALVEAQRPPPPADPFADPKHDPYNILKYITSNVLTGIAFTLVLLVGLAQSWLVFKWGAKWMLSMVIGCYTFALGIGLRFGLHVHPESRNLYIVEDMFVVLSPCAFIAATYVLLGRLARFLSCEKHLVINPRRITLVFVSSDVSTFLIQATGGGITASANSDHMGTVGARIFLVGLVIQLLSFIVFAGIFLLFLFRVYTRRRDIWTAHSEQPWYKDWRSLAGALFLSCVGILIRSVYRTIELSEGFGGPLSTSEALFYGLDTLPLFIAILVFVPFWPGRYISSTPITARKMVGHVESIETIPLHENRLY